MSASVHDLIGQIINPQPALFATPTFSAPARPSEPLHVLIGRIICPEAPKQVTSEAPPPVLDVPAPM